LTRATLLKATLRAVLEQQRIADLLRSRYELTSNPKDMVRTGEVGKYLADTLEVGTSNAMYRRAVTVAAHCGWKRITERQGVRWFRFMRRRKWPGKTA
jgi:hypothetical protein